MIGANSTIMCGITIGEGVVIGAGSVITESIPPHQKIIQKKGWIPILI
jgi:acetyltransferase-like isoleucine patch superfamily enzyme